MRHLAGKLTANTLIKLFTIGTFILFISLRLKSPITGPKGQVLNPKILHPCTFTRNKYGKTLTEIPHHTQPSTTLSRDAQTPTMTLEVSKDGARYHSKWDRGRIILLMGFTPGLNKSAAAAAAHVARALTRILFVRV